MTKKILVLFGLLTLGMFITAIYLEKNNLIPWKNYNYKFLNDLDSLNTQILTSYEDHGFLLLNDSIMVWGGQRLLKTSNNKLTQSLRNKLLARYGEKSINWEIELDLITLPYNIIKYRNDTVFYVIRDADTLTFELIDTNTYR